jgi:quinol-cytochrome oxidoreductase complex cytochrome b subunit
MSPERGNQNRSARIKTITQNFFFHIHSPKTHPYSLKATYTFGLGIMLGFLFLILVVTGVLLMMYYTPSVGRAYASVKDIVFIVKGGRYIRNVHRWAGYGMVIVGFLHLIRTFYTGSYLKRRTLNWIIGVALLLIILLSNFSGYLLPWDQLAYWAVTIGSNIAASARELTDALGITQHFDPGGFVKSLLIGGETVGQAALSRFFMLHVIFLPLTFLVLTSWHFWRIRKDGGISRPENADEMFQMEGGGGDEEKKAKTDEISTNNLKKEKIDVHILSWPTLMWAELAVLALICAVLMMTAFFIDAPLKEQANPMLPENPAKSPWYFLGIQELVSYSAFAGGIIVPLLFIYFLVSIPFKDREEQHIGIWFSSRIGKRITLYDGLCSSCECQPGLARRLVRRNPSAPHHSGQSSHSAGFGVYPLVAFSKTQISVHSLRCNGPFYLRHGGFCNSDGCRSPVPWPKLGVLLAQISVAFPLVEEC